MMIRKDWMDTRSVSGMAYKTLLVALILDKNITPKMGGIMANTNRGGRA
jgi:hypothetical protein